jgi:transaldolase
MELYLDSVNFKEIDAALDLGFLTGVTTTPTFMHREGITDIDSAMYACCYVCLLQCIHQVHVY